MFYDIISGGLDEIINRKILKSIALPICIEGCRLYHSQPKRFIVITSLPNKLLSTTFLSLFFSFRIDASLCATK
jgi:hypothetical protein